MARLSARELESRRLFDWEVVRRMNKLGVYMFTAHRTAEDAEKGRNAIEDQQDARFAVHYRAEFNIPTLIGEGQYSQPTLIRVDASRAGYPFQAPTAWVISTQSSKVPYSPHFSRSLSICDGTVWRSDGTVLLAQYLIHLAHLLNWDEVMDNEAGGHNPAAVRWWRQHVNRPLNPSLVYPELPVALMYGEGDLPATGGFRPLSIASVKSTGTGGFRPRG